MKITRRLLITVALVIMWSWFNFFTNQIGTLATGAIAGNQFDNSAISYLGAVSTFRLFSGIGMLSTVILLVLLCVLWQRPVTSWIKTALTVMALVCLFSPQTAWAYFDTTDKTEAYTILPNESAFWIPDVGANKDTQAQAPTEDYYNANKIFVKRYIVPHAKLSGSGGWSNWDSYVPTGRLIIVDRTPYSREWVDAKDRGTSVVKQGFPCQSKEGLNITTGISIGVHVEDDNAAKYLAHFGVQTDSSANRSDPAVIFTSVYYSRKVSDVMDDVGRKEVQTLVCNEISKRSFNDANTQAADIITSVAKNAKIYFNSVGITQDFLGWADTFAFDPTVQDAVNRRYIASQDQIIANELAPYATTIQQLAAAQALRSFGDKTDGKLPTTVVGLPPNIGALLSTLLSTTVAPVTGAGH